MTFDERIELTIDERVEMTFDEGVKLTFDERFVRLRVGRHCDALGGFEPLVSPLGNVLRFSLLCGNVPLGRVPGFRDPQIYGGT